MVFRFSLPVHCACIVSCIALAQPKFILCIGYFRLFVHTAITLLFYFFFEIIFSSFFFFIGDCKNALGLLGYIVYIENVVAGGHHFSSIR